MDKNPEKITEYSLQPFFEQTTDLLCIAGFDGYFKKINPALCKLLEYSKEELMAKPVNHFVHPEDKQITAKHRQNIHAGKPLLNFENRYISKSGKTLWFSWTSIPQADKEVVYAIAKNITHKKKLEQKRNKLLSELTQSNKQLKQLNFSTSHDLRSPISSILTIFGLMDISNIKEPETREFVELLKTSTEKLKRTLDQHIDGLKNNKTLHIPVGDLNIADVLKSVINSLESLISDSETTFDINLDDFQIIEFHPDYLESIFLNLISNSIKYAHPDRPPVISITTQIAEGKKQLIFSDNGRGFDSEKQGEKVFGLYQKFHDLEDSKGIGLYLVYNHVSSLGGHISVDSKVDIGTTFTITFQG
ncbi:PAS domain-containing sensor histidine kinase [Gracilimonas sp.]|uniref:PAS domain-containing sensor histidine kinase n=1 Tax=Gracilimonas sp. TaxID=1974203 RepID=UPI0032EF2602